MTRDDNANGARPSASSRADVPVSVPLVASAADYMHGEYGDLDFDYVFMSPWSGAGGSSASLPGRDQNLAGWLRARTNLEFSPQALRHSRATGLIRGGLTIEVVSRLLTQPSPMRPTGISSPRSWRCGRIDRHVLARPTPAS